MARSITLALALLAVACAGTPPPATIFEAVAIVHPFDPSAPIAFRQWPMEFLGCTTDGPPSYGATFHLWRDHAVLTLDDEPLHAQWKRGARRKLRVSRWTVTTEQCSAIPSLYDEGLAVIPVRDEDYGLRLGASAHIELVIEGRKVNPDEVDSYGSWLSRTWNTIEACAKKKKAI